MKCFDYDCQQTPVKSWCWHGETKRNYACAEHWKWVQAKSWELGPALQHIRDEGQTSAYKVDWGGA